MITSTSPSPSESKCHLRLEHAGMDRIRQLENKSVVTDLNLQDSTQFTSECLNCIEGKHHRTFRSINEHRSDQPGEVIYSDVCGPMKVKSLDGSSYFVTLIDECSEYTVVVPIAQKIYVALQFKRFHGLSAGTTAR